MKYSLVLFASGLTSLWVGLMGLAAAQSTSIANPPQQLLVFGDSLSDVGNFYKISQQTVPASPPYADGRFSNGSLWVEVVGTQFNLKPTLSTSFPLTPIPPDGVNFALAGAASNAVPLPNGLFSPGFLQQVNGFLGRLKGQPVNSKALFTVWIGANDYASLTPQGLVVAQQEVAQTLGNISLGLESLIKAGATQILVFNLPDIGKSPVGKSTHPGYLSLLSRLHNYSLNQLLPALRQKYPGVVLQLVDVYSLTNDAIQNPSKYGFTNVTESCLNPTTLVPCPNPDQYLFWDNFHPARVAHQAIANLVLQNLAIQPAKQTIRIQPQISLTGNVHTFPQIGMGLGTGK